MKDYRKNVEVPKKATSLRMRHKLWMNMPLPQPKTGRKIKSGFISSLLDIGKNMDALTGDEAIFYADQQGER